MSVCLGSGPGCCLGQGQSVTEGGSSQQTPAGRAADKRLSNCRARRPREMPRPAPATGRRYGRAAGTTTVRSQHTGRYIEHYTTPLSGKL